MKKEEFILDEIENDAVSDTKSSGFGGFWSRYRLIIITVLLLAVLIVTFIVMSVTKTHNDMTIALYTDNGVTIEQKNVLSTFFSRFAEDTDRSGIQSVGIDDCVLSDADLSKLTKAVGAIDADHVDGVRGIYLLSRSAFEYITDIYPDMFESFEGNEYWIPLDNTRLDYALEGYGFDCTGYGLSLLSDFGTENSGHAPAVSFLRSLRLTYPDVFLPVDALSPSDAA